jgi:hypothetical protein
MVHGAQRLAARDMAEDRAKTMPSVAALSRFGRSVAAKQDEVILGAILRRRIWLPYACRKRTCGCARRCCRRCRFKPKMVVSSRDGHSPRAPVRRLTRKSQAGSFRHFPLAFGGFCCADRTQRVRLRRLGCLKCKRGHFGLDPTSFANWMC